MINNPEWKVFVVGVGRLHDRLHLRLRGEGEQQDRMDYPGWTDIIRSERGNCQTTYHPIVV